MAERPKSLPPWLIAGGTLAVLLAALAAVWRFAPVQGAEHHRRLLALTTEQAGLRLGDYIRFKVSLLEGLAREWSAGGLADLDALHARALTVQAESPGFQAITWVSPRGVIEMVVPFAPNRPALGRDVHETPAAGEALETARRTRRVTFTAPIALFQSGRGIAVYAPTGKSGDTIDGFVGGAFRIADMVEDCLRPAFLADFDVAIVDDGQTLFETRPIAEAERGRFARTTIEVPGRSWTLYVAPSLAHAPTSRETTLFAWGLGMAVIAAAFVYLAAARRRDLRRSEATRRAIIEAMPDVVIQTRPDGSIHAIHGGPRSEMPADFEVELAPHIAQAMRAPHSTSFEVPVARRSGQPERWLEVRVTALASQEGLAIVRDVTARHTAEADQKKLEAKLRHAQRMDAVGQLAGGLAHDFNNLMTAVIAHGELARDAAGIDPETREDIDQIIQAARRAAQLTKRLLTFSRRGHVDPKPLSVGELMKSLEPMVRRLVREAITVRFTVDPRPTWIVGDPGQIEQVVMNLVANAADAIPVTGQIDIEVRPVMQPAESDPGAAARKIEAQLREGPPTRAEGGRRSEAPPPPKPAPMRPYVEIIVRDTGEGMSRDVLDRLFEPYFTTKETGQGAGLGLAIVYGVVTQSGGRIQVDSRPGEGTTVRALLPAVEPPAAAPTPPESTEVEPGTGTVLLVEDDPLVRKAAVRGLEKAGYVVIQAQDGSEAVGILAERRSDIKVVVTDLVMPVMGGRELVHWMAHKHPEVPVVLTSGYAEDTSGLADRVSTFLSKPYSPLELSEAIREATSVPSKTPG